MYTGCRRPTAPISVSDCDEHFSRKTTHPTPIHCSPLAFSGTSTGRTQNRIRVRVLVRVRELAGAYVRACVRACLFDGVVGMVVGCRTHSYRIQCAGLLRHTRDWHTKPHVQCIICINPYRWHSRSRGLICMWLSATGKTPAETPGGWDAEHAACSISQHANIDK